MTENEVSNDPVKQYATVTFAQLNKLLSNVIESSKTTSALSKKYDKEAIVRFIENPERNEKQLRSFSNHLYSMNSSYKTLIRYFANLINFHYIIEPVGINKDIDEDSFQQEYFEVVNTIENMNISHEMIKVLRIAYRNDVFYGYEHSSESSYFIQKLNHDYCRISGIEDGVFVFDFDFSYFDNKDKNIRSYPKEFITKYLKYKKDKKNMKWQQLEGENTVCIKVNEDLDYPIPPFIDIFEDVFDIEEAKRQRNIKNKMDNYMLLTQLIPVDGKNGDQNKFLIDLDTAINFHNQAMNSLPEEVGLVTSPMKIDSIKLERKDNDTNAVGDIRKDYLNSSGINDSIFGGGSNNNASLNKAIRINEQNAFNVLRQIERWINRKLKYQNTKYTFRIRFLDSTIFNSDELRKDFLNAAQFGFPVRQEVGSLFGMSPSSLSNKALLENKILDLNSVMIPLSSTHTQTVNSEGQPSKHEDDLSEEGIKTREADKNLNT